MRPPGVGDRNVESRWDQSRAEGFFQLQEGAGKRGSGGEILPWQLAPSGLPQVRGHLQQPRALTAGDAFEPGSQPLDHRAGRAVAGVPADAERLRGRVGREALEKLQQQWLADLERTTGAVVELQDYLDLPQLPHRIECYDISNLQGTSATGSMVVFVKGVPRKSDYRRFRIRTVEGADDYAMLREVLGRRLRRLTQTDMEERRAKNQEPSSWALRPDLMIIDGGKGQLNAALEVLKEHGLSDIPVVALAKAHEEIFLPDRAEPTLLPPNSQGLFLIQRIRDEAHRFAVEYHRDLRGKSAVKSQLEDIPDIGPRRRQALLKHFGSAEAIAEADLEELLKVPGMTRQAAQRVKEYLQ